MEEEALLEVPEEFDPVMKDPLGGRRKGGGGRGECRVQPSVLLT